MGQRNLASFLLRIGLASVLLYASVASLIDPDSWVGYLPTFAKELLPARLLLTGFSIYQIALSLWLLSGVRAYEAAIVASGTMLAISLANLGLFDIVFRDIGLLFSALALVALHRRE